MNRPIRFTDAMTPTDQASVVSPRRRWSVMRRAARMAAVFLLVVWVGPVTFFQTDSWRLLQMAGAPGSASAEQSVIPAGMALVLEPGTELRLRMRDGGVITGRFVKRTLLDPEAYAPRFAGKARSSAFAPLDLGETLQVSLRDGREWVAPFAGYAELALLLQNPVGLEPLRVPFEFAGEIRRADGERIEPEALTQAFRAGLLPSAEALELTMPAPGGRMSAPEGAPFRVAVEDIQSVTMASFSSFSSSSTKKDNSGVIVGLVVLGVLVAIVLIAAHHREPSPSCTSIPDPPTIYGLAHPTTRPFDRYRGCYVGDPLLAADPWPGAAETRPATALADATTGAEGIRVLEQHR